MVIDMNLNENFKDRLNKIWSTPAFKAISNTLIAILLGIIVGLIIIVISNPSRAHIGAMRLLRGPFNNPINGWIGIGQILYRATPLVFTGLAVAFAFKAGVFNIGASGQYTMGLFVALIVGVMGTNLGRFQWPIAILAGGLAGAFWGMFPGIFQAFFKVNVVITGIMFNYIGLFLVNGLLGNPLRKYLVDSATNRTIKVKGLARTPFFFLDKIFPRSGVDFGIILAIIVAIIAYYIINKTVFGREIKSVGMNRDAARYAGVNEKKMIIASMSISGLFAGIGGALFILAPSVYNLGNNYSLENVILNAGFDGIPIALLANSNPIGVIFSAIFVSYIKVSDVALQSVGYASEMVNIIISIILYFSAFSLIIGQFILKLVKRKNKANAEEVIL